MPEQQKESKQNQKKCSAISFVKMTQTVNSSFVPGNIILNTERVNYANYKMNDKIKNHNKLNVNKSYDHSMQGNHQKTLQNPNLVVNDDEIVKNENK